MAVHVAILLKPYIRLILAGRKTIESRLTRTARPPYGCIEAGERIYFKCSAGPYMATAIAARVAFYEDLTTQKLRGLYKRYNKKVCGDRSYWTRKRHCRFATFITLGDVEPTQSGPALKPSRGIAWFVLDQFKANGEVAVKLTAGAIRNHYLRLTRIVDRFPADAIGSATRQKPGLPIHLLMPDSREIETDITDDHMIRWRGWSAYYREHDLRPGDVVHFVHLDRRRYRVHFVRGS